MLMVCLLGMLRQRNVTSLLRDKRLSHRLNVAELTIRSYPRIEVHWNSLHVLRSRSGHNSHGNVISLRNWHRNRHLRLNVSIDARTLIAHGSLWTFLPALLVTVIE